MNTNSLFTDFALYMGNGLGELWKLNSVWCRSYVSWQRIIPMYKMQQLSKSL
jgi:hypothetical protein